MGAEDRQSVLDLKKKLAELSRDARRYSFFRLVYLLERVHTKAPPLGGLGPAAVDVAPRAAD